MRTRAALFAEIESIRRSVGSESRAGAISGFVEDVAAFEVAPDFACEVLSPSTEARDRAVKMPIYARERVTHVWLVQPAQRTLEVYRLDGELSPGSYARR